MFNKNFYPTPDKILGRMIAKISGHPDNILEPSAGSGNIIEAIQKRYRNNSWSRAGKISAIELDPSLRAMLIGKGVRVLDSDFLAYAGSDHFDLIIMNPPFDEGDKHLLKAIDILFRGQIICLLNAETLKNPYTNTRKMLADKLNELKAEIEYIEGAFKDAERPTGVEVALINITKVQTVEETLFANADDKAEAFSGTQEKTYEVSNGKKIQELVADYNQRINIGTETIINYYKNYPKIGGWLRLNKEPDKYYSSDDDMTKQMQDQVNAFLVDVRKYFWEKCLDLKEVKSRMTEKKRNEFHAQVSERAFMEFTEKNIREFVLNLIHGYEKTLTEAVLEIFYLFSDQHSWDGNKPNEKNIHYFNGWKTNKSWKVGRKVIIPVWSYGGAFTDSYSGKWKMGYDVGGKLNDIDLVMNYFDGMDGAYQRMANALEFALERQQHSGISSTYFTMTCHKKGTIHLTFNDEDILRRFNVAACKGRGWLPCDYGNTKPYKELAIEERQVVDSFEGRESYTKFLGQPAFGNAFTSLQLEMGIEEEVEKTIIENLPVQASLF
jgi:hypothetical protein